MGEKEFPKPSELRRLYAMLKEAVVDESKAPQEYLKIRNLAETVGWPKDIAPLKTIIDDENNHYKVVENLLDQVQVALRYTCQELVEEDLEMVGRIMAEGGTREDADRYIYDALDKYANCVKGE